MPLPMMTTSAVSIIEKAKVERKKAKVKRRRPTLARYAVSESQHIQRSYTWSRDHALSLLRGECPHRSKLLPRLRAEPGESLWAIGRANANCRQRTDQERTWATALVRN